MNQKERRSVARKIAKLFRGTSVKNDRLVLIRKTETCLTYEVK